jgi:ribosomal-protein-alanine acetyltransferase
MKVSLTVRTATPADVAEIMNLERVSPEAAHWSQQQYEAIFSPGGPRRKVWIAEDDNLQGFLIASVHGDEWELENIAVAATARRRGIAGQLLSQLISGARTEKAEAIFLEVRESNRAARALYEKWGFQEVGRRPNYYREPTEDAVVYRLCFL